jgi:nitrogen fixation protein FixH
MSPTTLPTARREGGIDGRTVLLTFLGFFGVVFAVNGLLLYYALATHSGVVAQEPYRKGLAYNDRIAADARQSELGWSLSIDPAMSGRIALSFTDGEARPVPGLIVAGRIGRPASSHGERRLTFAEVEPGRYVAATGPLEAGTWQADIDARRATLTSASDDPVYRARRRLWLKP